MLTLIRTVTETYENATDAIRAARANGASYRQIADALNGLGVRTSRGKHYTADSVRRVCQSAK